MITISDVQKRIADGSSSAVKEVTEALRRAESAKKYHPLLHTIDARALERAKVIDEMLAGGKSAGRLAGVPFIAKDNMLAFGAPTTAASHILENFDAPYQAEVIERLEAEGAICIGKANLDAFAHGASTENSAYGPTLNPYDENRVAGGSSGGSAAGVALEIVPFALGSDTGGSIRQPASFCGVVGYKPTYGMVSRYGVVAMASSTDVIGPLANTVQDVETVLEILAGQDDKDSTTLASYFVPEESKELRLGVVSEWMGDGVDSEVKQIIEKAITDFEAQGYSVETVTLPSLKYSLAVYYVIVPAEVASNLARYDGIRYGVRKGDTSLSKLYETTRDEGFMDENKRRILIGNFVLSSGYYDAYFEKAAKVRTLIINEFEDVFKKCDLLLGPVAPTAAFKLGELTADPLQMYLADIMTVSASLAGLPAVSVPAGRTGAGLPVGLQIIGPRKADALVLSLAARVKEQKV